MDGRAEKHFHVGQNKRSYFSVVRQYKGEREAKHRKCTLAFGGDGKRSTILPGKPNTSRLRASVVTPSQLLSTPFNIHITIERDSLMNQSMDQLTSDH